MIRSILAGVALVLVSTQPVYAQWTFSVDAGAYTGMRSIGDGQTTDHLGQVTGTFRIDRGGGLSFGARGSRDVASYAAIELSLVTAWTDIVASGSVNVRDHQQVNVGAVAGVLRLADFENAKVSFHAGPAVVGLGEGPLRWTYRRIGGVAGLRYVHNLAASRIGITAGSEGIIYAYPPKRRSTDVRFSIGVTMR